MPVLKVKDASGVWLDIAGVGSIGPPGGPVPVGGNIGEVIVKTGPGDFEVGWAPARPRVVMDAEIATANTNGVANSLGLMVSDTVYMDITRTYLIMAGIRCINDLSIAAMAQMQVGIGTINLTGYDVTTSPDIGLWGSWMQHWYKPGTIMTTSGTYTCELRLMINEAVVKTVHGPRLTVIEF